jgi:hypothetical protein
VFYVNNLQTFHICLFLYSLFVGFRLFIVCLYLCFYLSPFA